MFDLDGTLLPMDQDVFVNTYFSYLVEKMAPYGYEPKKLIGSVWGGTKAMVMNDGSCRNEEAFWKYFSGIYGRESLDHIPVFEDFYAHEFQKAQKVCGCSPKAKETVDLAKKLGARVIMATNPLFPTVATHNRIRWAGMEPEMFELITTYENSTTCKPNPAYYREILDKAGLSPEECLMVGNDVAEDMVAETLGMRVFLLTDCLINKEEKDLSAWPHGDFEALEGYLREQAGR